MMESSVIIKIPFRADGMASLELVLKDFFVL
jgi:hypothetical protein